MSTERFAAIRREADVWQLLGQWTVACIASLSSEHFSTQSDALSIDASGIDKMDTAGAWLLHRLLVQLAEQSCHVSLVGLSTSRKALLDLVKQQSSLQQQSAQKILTPVASIGKFIVQRSYRLYGLVSFLGEVILLACRNLSSMTVLQIREVLLTIYKTGYAALPIVALLSLMVGITLAYQMGIKLESYGANLYIVDLMGMAMFREFGPLITAIIAAGRSGSAFTAELATMQVNQEIDALRALGVEPTGLLVLPKAIGMMISITLLTIWANFFGMLGGMIMSYATLGITVATFIHRFKRYVSLTSLYIGLAKAPIFALIIVIVGCFQGFKVTGGARGVGQQTTFSVVQAIFFIIVVDALFSVLYGWMGI